MKKKLFLKFTGALSFYYMSYAVILGFSTLFLQQKGFSNTEIGFFFACSAIFCIILQILSSSFLDRHAKISARTLTLISGMLILFASILLYTSTHKYIILTCYTFIGSLMLTNSSLFNSFGMEYINENITLNYSLSRGFGSLFYACTSFLTGILIEHFSVMSIFPLFFLIHTLMFVFLISLKPVTKTVNHSKLSEDTNDFFVFFKKNPLILFLFLSILLVYISYTSINNFHINIIESVGGSSKELGISVSLSAMLELPAMALFIPLSKKFSYQKLLCLSCIFFFLKAFSLLFAKNVICVYLSQCLQFFSYGLFIPASTYFINSILSMHDKTKGQAALGIFTFGLSGLISSLLSGIMLDYFSVRTMLAFESGLAFFGIIGVFIACHKLKPAVSCRF